MEDEFRNFSDMFKKIFAMLNEEKSFNFAYHLDTNMDNSEIKFDNIGNVSNNKADTLNPNEKEIFIDIFEEKDSIDLIIEIPCIENRKDIILNEISGNEIEIITKNIQKIIKLPSNILSNSTKATFNNGILHIHFQKKKRKK